MKLDGELVVNFGARLLGRFRRVFDGILWDGERINIVALFEQVEQAVYGWAEKVGQREQGFVFGCVHHLRKPAEPTELRGDVAAELPAFLALSHIGSFSHRFRN